MTFRVNAVRLKVITASGALGTQVSFEDGLNVVRASNSSGKTQLLQGIAFALGVEGMFGAGSGMPLGSALTSEVTLPDGSVVPVVRSWAAVELQNQDGALLVAQRFASHPTVGRNLVRVWREPVLTQPGPTLPDPVSMHVRESGSAQQERGFHAALAAFAGWDLPTVPRYTGGEAPLYVEVFFPYLYADQRSWNSAGARVVTQYQLREPSRRSLEFLLGLAGPAAAARRAALEAELTQLRAQWESGVRALQASAHVGGARVLAIPDVPAGATRRQVSDLQPSDVTTPDVEVLNGAEWEPLESAVERLGRIVAQSQQSRPSINRGGDASLASQLVEAERELADRRATAAMLDQNLSLLEAQVDALDRRISALEDERRRYQDLRTLVRLGGEDAEHSHALSDADCPTCHQSLEAVEAEDLGPVLGLDDTSNLLTAELATAQQMRAEAGRAQDSARAAHAAVAREVDAQVVRVRSIQSDLIAPEGFPSETNVSDRISAELRLAELARVRESVDAQARSLTTTAEAVVAARVELNGLPDVSPATDLAILERVEASMREQLAEFGFASYSAEKVTLDVETLKPIRAGFDIDADVSASDVVRLKIAYLNAIREVALEDSAPHPGLLLLDEPRQHELAEANFRAALRRLGASPLGQVIVTSAAPMDSLRQLLDGTDAEITAVPGRVLAPVDGHDTLDLHNGSN